MVLKTCNNSRQYLSVGDCACVSDITGSLRPPSLPSYDLGAAQIVQTSQPIISANKVNPIWPCMHACSGRQVCCGQADLLQRSDLLLSQWKAKMFANFLKTVCASPLCLQIYHVTGNAWLSRTLRMTVIYFWGRWYLPIPNRASVVTVVGAPIQGTHEHQVCMLDICWMPLSGCSDALS